MRACRSCDGTYAKEIGAEGIFEKINVARADDFSSNRHPALSFCLSMIFSEKPVPTFPDHALDRRSLNEIRGKPDACPA